MVDENQALTFSNEHRATENPERPAQFQRDDHDAPAPRPSTNWSKNDTPHLTRQQLEFLRQVAPPALESERAYGVPACIAMGQAILGSATSAGWGTSLLFRRANNPFGIKCRYLDERETGRGAGNTASAPTLSAQDPDRRRYSAFNAMTWAFENGSHQRVPVQFQRFPDLREAFRSHARLLACSSRYAPAMASIQPRARWAKNGSGIGLATPADDPDQWRQFAERLGPKICRGDTEHCGYSTNPGYSAQLIKLVVLYRLNDPRALGWYATGEDPGHRCAAAADEEAGTARTRGGSLLSAVERNTE